MTSRISIGNGHYCYSGPTCRLHGTKIKSFEEFFKTSAKPVRQVEKIHTKLPEPDKIPVYINSRYQDYGEEILENYGDTLEFANHSDRSIENGYDEYVFLNDCANEDVAWNNCWIVASEILENISAEDFDADEIKQIDVMAEGAGVYHAAIAASVEGEWIVYDYTARQFDKTLPFPLVAPQNIWKDILENRIGKGSLEWGTGDKGNSLGAPSS